MKQVVRHYLFDGKVNGSVVLAVHLK